MPYPMFQPMRAPQIISGAVAPMAWRSFAVARNFNMLGSRIPRGLLAGTFDGLVNFQQFNMENSVLGTVDPYAFYFLTTGTFSMAGSTIAGNVLARRAFSGMTLTYSDYEGTSYGLVTGADVPGITDYRTTQVSRVWSPSMNLSNCGLTELNSSSGAGHIAGGKLMSTRG